MRIFTLKELLKKYDAEKGWRRRKFGDQIDIEQLKSLVEGLKDEDNDLNSKQLFLLAEIIFQETTKDRSLSRSIFNELRKILFDGVVTKSWSWGVPAQRSIRILYQANLLTENNIKRVSYAPEASFSVLISLKSHRPSCLTQENWEASMAAKKPSLVAKVIVEFRSFGLLTDENRRRAHEFVNYVNELPFVLAYLNKYHLLHKCADTLLKNAQYIPALKELFIYLSVIQCLDEENIKLALSMPEYAKEALHAIHALRVIQSRDVSHEKAERSILSRYQAKDDVSYRKAILSIVHNRNRLFYDRVEIANLQTQSNVRAVLQYADYADYLARGLKGIAGQHDATERSAQYAFDGLLGYLNATPQVKMRSS